MGVPDALEQHDPLWDFVKWDAPATAPCRACVQPWWLAELLGHDPILTESLIWRINDNFGQMTFTTGFALTQECLGLTLQGVINAAKAEREEADE